MPHKRAKASIRKELAFQKGHDLPPNKLGTRPPKKKSTTGTSSSSSNGLKDIPKNMYRILNSEKIREEYKQRMKEKDGKAKNSSGTDGTTKVKKSKELRIERGEKLSDFNQRVEQAMRPKVSSVMKIARNKSIIKKPKPSNPNEPKAEEPPKPIEEVKKPKEFEPKPTKFSLNDIVMEPPIDLKKPLKKLPNESKKFPISNAQKRLIEEEREKAIKRYRQLKEERSRGENNES